MRVFGGGSEERKSRLKEFSISFLTAFSPSHLFFLLSSINKKYHDSNIVIDNDCENLVNEYNLKMKVIGKENMAKNDNKVFLRLTKITFPNFFTTSISFRIYKLNFSKFDN